MQVSVKLDTILVDSQESCWNVAESSDVPYTWTLLWCIYLIQSASIDAAL